MAKVAIPAPKAVTFPISSAGGVVQSGGFMARQIDIKNRPRFQMPMSPSGLMKKL